jgi:cytochrome c556
MNTVRFTAMMVSAALLAGTAAVATAAEPEDTIKYRRSMMKANGGHMAASAAIVTGKVDYKGHLGDHAKALAAINKDVASLFPKDSDFGETEALEAVWKKPDEFKKRAKDAQAKSDAFAKAVAGGDKAKTSAAFKELNDACKACHKDFRKEQK